VEDLMSKSKLQLRSRKHLLFGTVVIVLSLILVACTASPIPATGSTPGVDSTPVIGLETMPAVDATEPVIGEATLPAVDATEPVGAATTESPSMEGTSPVSEEAEINVVEDPEFGPILVGNDDMTLYIYTPDEENIVNCAGTCLENWPPLVTQGDPILGEGVDETLISTADLPDGQKIVTYDGHPLYYYINDTAAGDTTGQGVGGVWYVISPSGEIIGQ